MATFDHERLIAKSIQLGTFQRNRVSTNTPLQSSDTSSTDTDRASESAGWKISHPLLTCPRTGAPHYLLQECLCHGRPAEGQVI